MMERPPILVVSGLVKRFGSLEVLKGIDLTAQRGEVVSIIGPSGTGKSTLLRCINFLEKPTCGRIAIGDVAVQEPRGSRRDIARLRSRTAMVFQNYNLFRNKTALQNIMEPMTQVQGVPENEAREEALRILRVVGLEDKRDSYPAHLSGGQQQRVGTQQQKNRKTGFEERLFFWFHALCPLPTEPSRPVPGRPTRRG